MSHSQFHCTSRAYLDMHGLIFETSICYWQDQPGRCALSQRERAPPAKEAHAPRRAGHPAAAMADEDARGGAARKRGARGGRARRANPARPTAPLRPRRAGPERPSAPEERGARRRGGAGGATPGWPRGRRAERGDGAPGGRVEGRGRRRAPGPVRGRRGPGGHDGRPGPGARSGAHVRTGPGGRGVGNPSPARNAAAWRRATADTEPGSRGGPGGGDAHRGAGPRVGKRGRREEATDEAAGRGPKAAAGTEPRGRREALRGDETGVGCESAAGNTRGVTPPGAPPGNKGGPAAPGAPTGSVLPRQDSAPRGGPRGPPPPAPRTPLSPLAEPHTRVPQTASPGPRGAPRRGSRRPPRRGGGGDTRAARDRPR